jgi:hypothetical protein
MFTNKLFSARIDHSEGHCRVDYRHQDQVDNTGRSVDWSTVAAHLGTRALILSQHLGIIAVLGIASATIVGTVNTTYTYYIQNFNI